MKLLLSLALPVLLFTSYSDLEPCIGDPHALVKIDQSIHSISK